LFDLYFKSHQLHHRLVWNLILFYIKLNWNLKLISYIKLFTIDRVNQVSLMVQNSIYGLLALIDFRLCRLLTYLSSLIDAEINPFDTHIFNLQIDDLEGTKLTYLDVTSNWFFLSYRW
jgi:hypothetical protein